MDDDVKLVTSVADIDVSDLHGHSHPAEFASLPVIKPANTAKPPSGADTDDAIEAVANPSDGVCYSSTPEGGVSLPPTAAASPRSGRRPLREKDLLPLQVFAALCILIFPPSGLVAFLYARRTAREYREAVKDSDEDMARQALKHSLTTERLIIFSLLVGLLMYVMIIGLVERESFKVKHGDLSNLGHHVI